MNDPSDKIAKRAYELWHERGAPHGSPDSDWYRSEQELSANAAVEQGIAGDAPVQGEGDYAASRRYREDVKDFLDHADVKALATQAEPDSEQQAAELAKAEKCGKSRSKGDDPIDVKIMYTGRDGQDQK